MNFRTLLLTNIGTTNSVIIGTTDRYKPIITVSGVGVVSGDFSHTVLFSAIPSSDNLWLGLGSGSVVTAGLTSTFRTPAKFISQGLITR